MPTLSIGDLKKNVGGMPKRMDTHRAPIPLRSTAPAPLLRNDQRALQYGEAAKRDDICRLFFVALGKLHGLDNIYALRTDALLRLHGGCADVWSRRKENMPVAYF